MASLSAAASVAITIVPMHEDCAICLGVENPEELSLLEHNKHYFHVECLEKWRIVKLNCPTCRVILPKSLPCWKKDGYQAEPRQITHRLQERRVEVIDARASSNPDGKTILLLFIGWVFIASVFSLIMPAPLHMDRSAPY